MIKAVFIDIDDTLTNSNREISQRNREAIKKCIDKGIKIILTSGRSRKDALEYQQEIGTSPYIISSNGGAVYDVEKQEEIYVEEIEKENIKKMFDYALENKYRISFNYSDKLVMNEAFYPDELDKVKLIEELEKIINEEKIIQCVIYNQDIEKMKLCKHFIEGIEKVKIVNESKRLKNPELKPSKNYYCDIVSKQVSKGKAVEMLCEYLNISAQEIVVIGDGENDISMFEITPNSVAMANSLEFVKEKAKYITITNDEDGVAVVLEKLL